MRRDELLQAYSDGRRDFSKENLSGANLSGADLRWAILRWTDLSGAILSGADLRWADLRGADLRGAVLESAKLPAFQIPQEGSLIAWKKLRNGVIAKLEISESARRTATPIGRKCRAEYVKVLELSSQCSAALSEYGELAYIVGEIVRPDSYNDDIRVECTNGIHFFLTREEAEDYV